MYLTLGLSLTCNKFSLLYLQRVMSAYKNLTAPASSRLKLHLRFKIKKNNGWVFSMLPTLLNWISRNSLHQTKSRACNDGALWDIQALMFSCFYVGSVSFTCERKYSSSKIISERSLRLYSLALIGGIRPFKLYGLLHLFRYFQKLLWF